MSGMLRTVRKLLRAIQRGVSTWAVRLRCESSGEGLRVNRWSRVTRGTVLGNNVNFNGMEINGFGRVRIGDNFHSGRDCLMITQVHNYDGGTRIPYDDSYVVKDIEIGDNV